MFIQSQIVVVPGGWQFYQSELNWKIENPMEIDRNQAAEQLSTIRRANPRFGLNSDLSQCLLEIEQFNYMRLQRVLPLSQRGEYFYQPPPEEKKTSTIFHSKRSLPARLAFLARNAGAALNDFTPVDPAISAQRASRCMNCDQNERGDWLSRSVALVGEVVRDYVTSFKSLNLHVPNEEKLGSCLACDCPLPVKVWFPIDRIPMDDELKSRLETAKDVQTGEPLKCWILDK